MARELGTAPKLVAFALAVAVAFGGGALVGAAAGPEPDEAPHVEGGDHG